MDVSGRAQTEGAGRREPQAEEASGETLLSGCGDAEGDVRKKLLTPRARRLAVNWAINDEDTRLWRACRLVGQEPKTYRYASKRPHDDARCGSGWKNWLWNAGGLFRRLRIWLPAGGASHRTNRNSTGFIARKGR